MVGILFHNNQFQVTVVDKDMTAHIEVVYKVGRRNGDTFAGRLPVGIAYHFYTIAYDQRYAIDPTKIKNDLGWYPETMFAEGIVKTIKWNLDNQEWVKEVTSGDYQKYYEQMYSNR